MTFEEYTLLTDYLDYIRIANTSISLGYNDYELTQENKEFFDNKIILVPYIEGVEINFMINAAFEPYTDFFRFDLIESNVVKVLNGSIYNAFRISLNE